MSWVDSARPARPMLSPAPVMSFAKTRAAFAPTGTPGASAFFAAQSNGRAHASPCDLTTLNVDGAFMATRIPDHDDSATPPRQRPPRPPRQPAPALRRRPANHQPPLRRPLDQDRQAPSM